MAILRGTTRYIAYPALLISIVSAVSCVTPQPAKPENMMARVTTTGPKQPSSVRILCRRREPLQRSPDTSGLGGSADIPCDAYAAAVSASVAEAHLFSAVLTDKDDASDYRAGA
jgi:hypothetical protein